MRASSVRAGLVFALLLSPTQIATAGVRADDGGLVGNGSVKTRVDDEKKWGSRPQQPTAPPAPKKRGGDAAKPAAAEPCSTNPDFDCGFAPAIGGGAPPPPPNPVELAERATGQLKLPVPAARTSPAAPVETLVGLQTWLWVDPAQWRPITDSITAGSTTVTATVTPTGSRWDLGEGREECAGPGRPWRKGLGQDATTRCGYTYASNSRDQRGGKYRVAATVTYSASWTCTGACTSDGGDLGSISSPASVTQLQVGEREPVVIR